MTINDVKAVRRKFEREVVAFVVIHPELTYDQIAKAFGLKRKAVRVIVEAYQLPNRKPGRKPRKEPTT
ncbi:MAG: hypothetical protein WBE55_00055 [Candidatus Sulfotelmatobacter sp.]